MVYVILAGHGTFAAGLREAAEMILGEQSDLAVLGLFPGDTLDGFFGKLEHTLEQAGDPKDVVILTDLRSGTPFNAAMMACLKHGACCLAGSNLPMLLEVLSIRDEASAADVCRQAVMAGQGGIVDSLSLQSREAGRPHDE